MSIRTNPDPTAEIRIETELPALPAEGKARLRKLIGFLRKMPAQQFSFSRVVSLETNNCGTVCCAIGWTPAIFPELVKWRRLHGVLGVRVHQDEDICSTNNYSHAATNLFGMDELTASRLFDFGRQPSIHPHLRPLGGTSSADEVADALEHYIRLTETPRSCT